jgi:hypothetical protein
MSVGMTDIPQDYDANPAKGQNILTGLPSSERQEVTYKVKLSL